MTEQLVQLDMMEQLAQQVPLVYKEQQVLQVPLDT
jgi:hypothetical protein